MPEGGGPETGGTGESGGGEGKDSSSLDTANPKESPGEGIRVVFAGNFQKGGSCHKDDKTGCDVFSALYEPGTGTVREVDALVVTADISEQAPVQDPLSRFVLYLSGEGFLQDLYVYLPGGEAGMLVEHAREAAVSSDGAWIGYREESTGGSMDVVIASILDVTDTVELGEPIHLTDHGLGSEPVFFPGNERLAYYEKTGTPGEGATMIVHIESGEKFQFSEWNGCAHGSVNYSGSRYFCQEYHHLWVRDLEGDSWSDLERITFPDLDLADFPGCDSLSYAHPKYCGDDEHVMVTVSCVLESEIVSAELVLLEWDGRTEGKLETLFGRLAAEEFGAVDADSYMAKCLAVAEAN
jgi:hypothetical protein